MGGGMLLGLALFVKNIIKLWFWVMFAAIMLCGGIVGTVVALAIFSAFSYAYARHLANDFYLYRNGCLGMNNKINIIKTFCL